MSADDLKPGLQRVATGQPLSREEAERWFGVIMDGKASSAQIAGFIMALKLRGETADELAGLVGAMRARMITVEAPVGAIDVCGTGGDGQGTLNISTAVTFVLAGAGFTVAKHGNRALSSRTGAADVLVELGVAIEPPLETLPVVLRTARCAFLFAPRHHIALRHAAEARRELGLRTIFNLAGPMANPARVKRQLSGVYDFAWARPMAEALRELGCEKSWLVHGQGLDELTLSGTNQAIELDQGRIHMFSLAAADAGLPEAPLESIQGGDATYNAQALRALLAGERGAYRDTVLFNAAAGLIVAGATTDLREAAAIATTAIDSGAARNSLELLISASQTPASPLRPTSPSPSP